VRSLARSFGDSAGARLDARLLVAGALERERAWLLAHGDERLDAAAAVKIDGFGVRRRSGEPVAYILGEAWFFGRRFAVSSAVLVPRPETEHVVEAALADVRARLARRAQRPRVCDVGTGSGAIAITLAAEEPRAEVIASDVSGGALLVAEANALSNGAPVRFLRGDLGEPLLRYAPFDCIVANLPYVPSAEVPAVPDPVGFEPRVAVDGGMDGLALYRRLIDQLCELAAPGASAFFEAAPGTVDLLADAVVRALPGAHVEIGEDYAGLERWVAVALP
jgi:release factor glutamine methyltransferase